MIDKTSIKEASKHLFLWRNIYNALCRECKHKLVMAASDIKTVGTETVVERIKEITDNHFCARCRNITSKMLEENDK